MKIEVLKRWAGIHEKRYKKALKNWDNLHAIHNLAKMETIIKIIKHMEKVKDEK